MAIDVVNTGALGILGFIVYFTATQLNATLKGIGKSIDNQTIVTTQVKTLMKKCHKKTN